MPATPGRPDTVRLAAEVWDSFGPSGPLRSRFIRLRQLEEVADMRMCFSGRAMRSMLTAAAILCGLAVLADSAQAQILPAGVQVDAEGVLRVKKFADPTGELT